MNIRSLRFRITSWCAAMFAMSLLLFAIAIYVGMHSYLNSSLRRSLQADATSIAENLVEATGVKGDKFMVGEINEDFAPEVNSRFIRVSRADGTDTYVSPPPVDGSFDPLHVAPAPIHRWATAKSGFSRDEYGTGGEPLMVYSLPYTTRDGHRFLIEVGANYKQIRSTMHGLLTLFIVGIPVMVVLAFLGGYSVTGRALQPVREITSKAESISLAHPDERLPVIQSGDELDQLSRALNRMLDRLEDAFRHIHRFSADVSHELRTPLTIIRGELEALLRSPQSSAQNLETAGSCLEEVDRLTQIIDQLLVLSRFDVGDRLPMEVLDLGELAKSTADQMHLLVEEKSQSLVYRMEDGVRVEGNAPRLRQLIVNLLANAIKYTGNSGIVELAVGHTEGTAYIEVSDNGVGMPADALPHVFDRFFRADRARSRQTGGTGLGLSIVKAIASAHAGRVEISSEEGVGTRVKVAIPLANSSLPAIESGDAATRSGPDAESPTSNVAAEL